MISNQNKKMLWTVTYDNGVDGDDEVFFEWWEISNGEKSFKSDYEEDAIWLCGFLNSSIING